MRSFFLTCAVNLRLIFGGKFIWFLITSFALFAYFMYSSVWRGELPSDEMIYGHLFFPALLVVFYPATFGIQNDADQRILEIIFGIPGYMYKIWGARLCLIYALVAVVLALYAAVAYVLVFPVNPFSMALQLMFPVLFVGCLSFCLSTITRNGNATAILLIILSIAVIFLRDSYLANTMWDPALNPYHLPSDIHPVIWQNTVLKSRIFLAVGAAVCTLLGLLNLQKREKFV